MKVEPFHIKSLKISQNLSSTAVLMVLLGSNDITCCCKKEHMDILFLNLISIEYLMKKNRMLSSKLKLSVFEADGWF